ncbi:major facilitator superfamily domain-containing protein [Lipomyces tetrasporus]|uniref:Major facilitator superfamily domain-containing protein n=1 Tax=Lipomyces tetrasporus TaxID=54092 RepID=A0AAD7QUE6_9ASCO|nr:major facilitator superfamily domain-containing protein [Lipomyces tetrasporus]KAJ8101580.1 major facilitator superfamily domain-containing protein [Lipomyces tetrasporus]
MGLDSILQVIQPLPQTAGENDFRSRPKSSWDSAEIKDKFSMFIDEGDYQPNWLQRTLGQAWDTFRLPPKQRRYMQKLDANILLYAFLSFFIKTLDNSNISNAYVSGMKEDLHLYGNERNLFTTFFNIGYLIGAVPSQFILNRVRPSIWIPTCEFIWSGLVMAIAGCKSPNPIYGIRFMIGFFESVAYPGLAMVLGSWYLPSELAKRMQLYDAAWAIASMFSGYIQAGVYHNMNGLAGFKGWQWVFIIDGIIGIPIALLGYYSIPDFPINTRVIWMKQIEKEYSYVRMEEVGRKAPKRLTFKRVVGMFKSWRPYGFLWPWCLFNICDTTGYFNLWLDSLPFYSTEQVNLIPTGGYAISLVSGYLSANISDRIGYRWAFILNAVAWCFFGNLLLAIWNIPFGLKMFAFFCPDIGYALWGMMLAWSAEIFQDDAEMRGMLPALGSTLSYAMNAWLPVVIFPTQKAPKYIVGYQIITALIGLEFIGVLFMLYMSRREAHQRGRVMNKFGLAVDAEDAVEGFTAPRVSDAEKDVEAGVTVIDGLEPVDLESTSTEGEKTVVKEKQTL